MRSKLSKSLWMMMVGAATVFGAGCDEKPQKPTEDVVEPKAEEKVVAPSGALDKLVAPEPVIIYGGVDKASDMAAHLSELMLGSPTQGAAQMDDAVTAAAMRLGLKDGKALDTSKPLRVAIVDPKKHEQPYMIAVGIKSRDDFAKSLPEKHKKDDGGNAFSYTTPGMQAVFVNYVDDWAVFTGHKELFGTHKAFMVKLAGATVKGDAGFVIDVGHLTKLYGADLTTAIDEMKKATAAQAALPMAGGMDKLYDFMKSVADDLDKVIVTTTASKASGRLQFDMIAKTGSELDKSFKALEARKLEPMLARLPANAPAALVASFDPDSDSDLMRSLTAWSMQLALGQGAAEKDYSDALTAYWKGSSGEMAMVAHQHDGQLRLSMLAGVRDAEKVRTSMDTMRGMYKEEGFKKLYEQMNLEYTFKKGAYKVGAVDVDSVRAKFGKKAKGDDKLGLEQAMGPGADFLTQIMSHDFAITDNTVFSVYGTDSKKVMEAWIEGKVEGGLDKSAGVQAALKGAAPGTFFMLYGSPLAVAEAMQAPGGAAPAAGNGIAITAGSTGNVVHIVLDVPGDQAQGLMKMMGSMGGGF